MKRREHLNSLIASSWRYPISYDFVVVLETLIATSEIAIIGAVFWHHPEKIYIY
jgi:hypothetical protein